jgi:hypothetical protein
LWLRGKTLAIHGEIDAAELGAISASCARIWPMEYASVEADAVISVTALSTAVLDRLALHVRVGGPVLLVDNYTMSMSRSRFEALVGPSALEIVRCRLPHPLPFLRRGRKAVSCILRRRN